MSIGFLGGSSSTTKARRTPRKVTAPTFYMPVSSLSSSSSANSSQGRTPPERIDVGQMFAPQINATQAPTLEQDGSPDPLGSILGIFGKVAETPVNIANQFTKPIFGQRGAVGAVADLFDKTPVGDAARLANAALDTSSRMVGVAGNSYDMMLLRQTASMPDTMKLPDSIDAGKDPIASAVMTLMQLIPMNVPTNLARMNRGDMTVGQFRQLMTNRGMTPDQMRDVMSGKMHPFDPSLGAVRLTDDGSPLGQALDAYTRLAMDPTNLAFGLGGKVLRAAGVATHGIGLEKAAKAAGIVDYALSKPARETGTLLAEGAKTMAEGGKVVPTMKGLARATEIMQKGALWNARIGAAGLTTAVAADSALTFLGADKDNSGWGRQIKAFTSDIINDRPLSEGAVFMILSAVGTPLHEVVGETARGTKAVYRQGAGYGLYRAADIALGRDVVKQIGRESADNLVSWAARNMAQSDLRKYADFQKMFEEASAPRAASAKARLGQYVDRHMQRMIEDGRINAHSIADEIKRQDRFTEGMFRSVDARPFDAVRASKVWQKYESIQQRVGATLDPLGMFIGRNVTLTQEMSDIVLADMAAASGATPRMNSLIDAYSDALGADTPHAVLTKAIDNVRVNDPALYAEITQGIDTKVRKASKKGPSRTKTQINADIERAFQDAFDGALHSDVTVSRDWIRDMLERHTEVRTIDKAGEQPALPAVNPSDAAKSADPGGFTFLRYDLADAPATAPYAEARMRMRGLRTQMPTEREFFHELDTAERNADSEVLRPQADPATLRADAESQMTGEAQAAAGMWENIGQAALDEQVAINTAMPRTNPYAVHTRQVVTGSGANARVEWTYDLSSNNVRLSGGNAKFATEAEARAGGEEYAQKLHDTLTEQLGAPAAPAVLSDEQIGGVHATYSGNLDDIRRNGIRASADGNTYFWGDSQVSDPWAMDNVAWGAADTASYETRGSVVEARDVIKDVSPDDTQALLAAVNEIEGRGFRFEPDPDGRSFADEVRAASAEGRLIYPNTPERLRGQIVDAELGGIQPAGFHERADAQNQILIGIRPEYVRDAVPDPATAGSSAGYIKGSLPPEALLIRGDDGMWHPLTESAPTPDYAAKMPASGMAWDDPLYDWARPDYAISNPLYRQTTMDELGAFLNTFGNDAASHYHTEVNFARNTDSALSQRKGAGVRITVDGDALESLRSGGSRGSLRDWRKPMDIADTAQEVRGYGFTSPEYGSAIRVVEIAPGQLRRRGDAAAMVWRNSIEPKLLAEGWTKTERADGTLVYVRDGAPEGASRSAPASTPTPDYAAAPGTYRVSRYEEPGVPVDASKPHGLYVTIDSPDVESAHADLGPRAGQWDVTPNNPLDVSGAGNLSAGFSAFKQLSGDGAKSMIRESGVVIDGGMVTSRGTREGARWLAGELSNFYPDVEWTRYHDSYEMLEAAGARAARDAGYDAIISRDPKMPEFDEMVVLDQGLLDKPVAQPPTPDYAAIEQQVREGAPGTGAGQGYRDIPAPEQPAPGAAPAEPQVYRPTTSSVSATKITAADDRAIVLDEMAANDPAVAKVRGAFDAAFIGANHAEVPAGMTVDRFTEIVNQAAWEASHGKTVDARRVGQLLTAPKALPLAAKGLNWDPSVLNAYDLGIVTTDAMIKATPMQQALESEFGLQQYTVKLAPKDALAYGDVSQPLPDDYLYHSALAAMVFDNRAAAGMERMLHAVTGGVANTTVAQQAHQAWTSELVGKYNAPVAEVDAFMANLAKRLNESVLNRTGMLAYRGITSLPTWELKAAFNESFSEATRSRIITAGDTIDRIMDRSANRFIRNMHERNLANADPDGKGRLAAAQSFLPRVVEGTYKGWQAHMPGGVVRSISKTYYFLFRFVLDPRWWLMNGPETDWIAGARYGVYATRAEGATSHVPGIAARTHGAGRAPRPGEMAIPDEAWLAQDGGSALHVKQRASIEARILEGIRDENGNVIEPGLLRKNIDRELDSVVSKALDQMAEKDPTLVALQERFGKDPRSWSQQLYEMLYDFDTKGVQKAVDEAVVKEARLAKADLTPAERAAQVEVEQSPVFQALRDRLVEVNQKTFADVTNMVGGNMNRSNAERVLNSYWLYWPLSYQIKATRFLAKTMLTGSAIGPNAAAAVTVENLRQTHIARMATDEDYANIFKKNETLWLLAQQIVPITPWDMGVSLSRLPRYVGSWMGVFPEYQSVQDPLAAAQKMTQLGPLYTVDMLRRVYSEAQRAMNN